MTDLIIKLLLKNEQFNSALKASSQQIRQFQAIGSKITGTIGKFAGAIGLAVGANEFFERSIRGCQTTSDEYDKVMAGLTTSVDTFFYALSNGDFSAFDQGLLNLIARAQETQAALDQLWNTALAFDFFSLENFADFSEYMNTARDRRNTPEVHKKALDDAQKVYEKQRSNTQMLVSDVESYVSSVLTEGNFLLDKEDVSYSDIKKVLHVDLEKNRDARKNKWRKDYNELQGIYNGVVDRFTTTTVTVDAAGFANRYKETDWTAVKNEMKQYKKKYGEAALYHELLVKMPDDGREKSLANVVQKMSQAETSRRTLATMGKQIVRLRSQKYEQIRDAGPKSLPKFVDTTKSFLDNAQEEMNDINKTFNDLQDSVNKGLFTKAGGSEAGLAVWDKYEKAVKDVNNQFDELKKKGKNFGEDDLKAIFKFSDVINNDLLPQATALEEIHILGGIDDSKKSIEELEEELEYVYTAIKTQKPEISVTYVPRAKQLEKLIGLRQEGKLVETPEFAPGTLGDLENQRKELIDQLNHVKTNEEFVEIQAKITVVSDNISHIKGEKTEGEKNKFAESVKWANDYATALQNVAQAVSAVNSTPLEDNSKGWTQWTTQFLSQAAAVIATYYSLAMAAGTKNAMEWPFPANLGILASLTAAIISVFASLPTFSEGGIFSGNNTIGDMNYARVNSGEMILNNRQQRNLFNLLNNGSSSTNINSNNVVFTLHGSELKGVLENYNKKMRRV